MKKNKFALLLITIAFLKCFAQQNAVELNVSKALNSPASKCVIIN